MAKRTMPLAWLVGRQTAACDLFPGQRIAAVTHDPDRLGIAHQPQRQVDAMHTQVDQRAATGRGFAAEPTAELGKTMATQPTGAGAVDFAQNPAFDDALERLALRVEAVG